MLRVNIKYVVCYLNTTMDFDKKNLKKSKLKLQSGLLYILDFFLMLKLQDKTSKRPRDIYFVLSLDRYGFGQFSQN